MTRAAKRRIASSSYSTANSNLRDKAQSEPVRFISHILGVMPWQVQADILEAVRDNPRVAVRSCHGIGKSFIAGNTALWFLCSFKNSIVLTTAPTWRQVEKLVWKEIRSSYRRSKYFIGGHLPPKASELQINGDEWLALGISTNDPDRFQGFHAPHLLVIVDEAAGVDEDIFEAIEGVLTSEHCCLLLLGNPTKIGGTFYRAFREGGWETLHVSALDTPNFTAFGIIEDDLGSGEWERKITAPLPAPWLITPAWAADKFKRWGPDSPAYQARVLGEFPTLGENTVIPLAWIEAAMERDVLKDGPVVVGVDVARFGSDNTVIAIRKGRFIERLDVYSKLDTMEITGHVVEALRSTGASVAKVDVIGIGAGVVDRLKEQKLPVEAVNVAEKARDPERFANLRSELWWLLREALDPKNPDAMALPQDDDLLADLSNPVYKINSKGQIALEPKDETKSRLHRSPDRADAVVMSIAPSRTCVHVDIPIPRKPIMGRGYTSRI